MCSLLILNSKTLIALISRFRHFLNLTISLDFKLDLGEIKMSDIVELFRSYSNKKISENLLRELKSFKNNWIKKPGELRNFKKDCSCFKIKFKSLHRSSQTPELNSQKKGNCIPWKSTN